jgi:hypothetical protein
MTDPAAARRKHTLREQAARVGRPERRAGVVSLIRALCITAGLATAYYLLPLDAHGTLTTSLILASGLLAVALVSGWEAWLIVHSPHPRLRAVEALATTVALYLVLFATTYYLVERAVPGSFSESLSRTDALYFTLTTFSTVGFGDIVAVSPAGRVAVMCQMVCGLLLVGVAARVLSAAVRAGLRRQGREPPE